MMNLATDWSLSSWRGKAGADPYPYPDQAALATVVAKLRTLPPLVTSWEVERLKSLLAEAQEGKRFLLQCGDGAETTASCRPDAITNQLKPILQMSLLVASAFQAPIVRVGRLAGQYSMPSRAETETRNGVVLPSYFGDQVNSRTFTTEARTPDPQRLLRAHSHAAITLNFMRSLLVAGFADMHHTEYWDLGSVALSAAVREEYAQTMKIVRGGLRFMSAVGEKKISDLTTTDLYTSHEGRHLEYEAAQTFTVPHREGHYVLTSHFPWIGDEWRSLSGAHVEFFRGVRNPIAVKLGAGTDPRELPDLLQALNPENEPGKLTFVTQLGADHVVECLPALIDAVAKTGRRVLWTTDPMAGNTREGEDGDAVRHFDEILDELRLTFQVHAGSGSRLGGVHLELSGSETAECSTTGASAPPAPSLGSSRLPRLNHAQALETGMYIARHLERLRQSIVPPAL